MIKQNILITIVILLLTNLCWADNDQIYDVKELKDAGKISSLENILDKLSEYDINRLLEVELKLVTFQERSRQTNQQFIYEIEYINGKGIVLEIEVDALTAQVLKLEREH